MTAPVLPIHRAGNGALDIGTTGIVILSGYVLENLTLEKSA